jgi:hypothetical protein
MIIQFQNAESLVVGTDTAIQSHEEPRGTSRDITHNITESSHPQDDVVRQQSDKPGGDMSLHEEQGRPKMRTVRGRGDPDEISICVE